MKLLERLHSGIGSGEVRGIFENSDGRHYCRRCSRLMRPGQQCTEQWGPAIGRRQTIYTYRHDPDCPQTDTAILSARAPRFSSHGGRSWDTIPVTLPDGRKVTGRLDTTWGRYIYFQVDGWWKKTSILNLSGKDWSVDLREDH